MLFQDTITKSKQSVWNNIGITLRKSFDLLRRLSNDTAKILPTFFVIAVPIQRANIRNVPRTNSFFKKQTLLQVQGRREKSSEWSLSWGGAAFKVLNCEEVNRESLRVRMILNARDFFIELNR